MSKKAIEDRELLELYDSLTALNVAGAPKHGAHAQTKFSLGDRVRKIKGSRWQGRIVGTYSTSLTPEGYAVESETEIGSVQIYPAAALERIDD